MKTNFKKVTKTSANSKNKVNKADLLQLVLLLVPAFKLARKILSDRKMK